MRVVDQLEAPVVQAFKNFPAMPESGREFLVKAWPYLALIFAVLQLFGAYSAWRVVQFMGVFDYYHVVTPGDQVAIYLGIGIMLVDAVILFMAFSPLQRRAKRGWDLLFLGNVISVVYAVAALFMSGYGFGSFVMSLLTAAIGFYLLVQVRSKYPGKVAPHAKAKTAEKK